MVNATGPGAFKERNMVAFTTDKNVTKDGKLQFIDIQMDPRDTKNPETETDFHLTSKATSYTDSKGEERKGVNHGASFGQDQYDAIKASGTEATAIDPKGNEVKAIYFKADLTKNSDGTGLRPNFQNGIKPSDFEPMAPEAVFEEYKTKVAEGKEAKAAEKEAEAAEKSVEKAPEKEVEAEPEFG